MTSTILRFRFPNLSQIPEVAINRLIIAPYVRLTFSKHTIQLPRCTHQTFPILSVNNVRVLTPIDFEHLHLSHSTKADSELTTLQ